MSSLPSAVQSNFLKTMKISESLDTREPRQVFSDVQIVKSFPDELKFIFLIDLSLCNHLLIRKA